MILLYVHNTMDNNVSTYQLEYETGVSSLHLQKLSMFISSKPAAIRTNHNYIQYKTKTHTSTYAHRLRNINKQKKIPVLLTLPLVRIHNLPI